MSAGALKSAGLAACSVAAQLLLLVRRRPRRAEAVSAFGGGKGVLVPPVMGGGGGRFAGCLRCNGNACNGSAVSYTHLRAHETDSYL
eukprot:4648087-Pleurochrysis_carterae.AAC.1